MICDALVNGMGIARLPTFIVGEAIRYGEVTIILDDWRPSPQNISLLYPSSRHLSAEVRAFVDLAVDHFRPALGDVNECDKNLPV